MRTPVAVFRLLILGGMLLLSYVPCPSFAQPIMPNTQTVYTAPGTAPPQGAPPAPGSGPIPGQVTPGDQGTSPLVPKNQPQPNVPEHGTNFQYQNLPPRSRVNLLVSDSRGTRVALTMQPDQLTEFQKSQIGGLLGGVNLNNQPYQNITTSQATILKIQQALNPYPATQGTLPPYSSTNPSPNITSRVPARPSRNYISTDTQGVGYPRYPDSLQNQYERLALTTTPADTEVRQFSRYLVIKGVVIGCVELVFAGALFVFGHQYAGNKAIAAAGGVMLLLMAYSLWKVDMFNNLNARGPEGQAVDLQGNILDGTPPDSFNIDQPPLSAEEEITGMHTYEGDNTLGPDQKSNPQSGSNPNANLPVTPALNNTRTTGLPLMPLGAAH